MLLINLNIYNNNNNFDFESLKNHFIYSQNFRKKFPFVEFMYIVTK